MATQPSPRYDIRFDRDALPQVEPASGFWVLCPPLRVPSLEEIRDELGKGEQPFPPTLADEKREFAELQSFYTANVATRPPPVSTSVFLSEALFFRRPPAGATLSPAAPGGPLTGPELASLFEAETPGLWHRHVLNVLLDPVLGPMSAAGKLSPPRQALIWAALDVAILGALSAAWNYKWVAKGLEGFDYRRRPSEYAQAQGIPPTTFQVLFDLEPTTRNGRIFRDPKRRRPSPGGTPFSPATPRHPAYPSGHSTYSAAASHVLGCLFRNHVDPRLPGVKLEGEFTKLADDIGLARLHGGVHWRSDHVFGQALGNAVGRLVIAQLGASGIPVPSEVVRDPPPERQVEAQADAFEEACGEGSSDFCGAVAQETQRPFVMQNVPLGDAGEEASQAAATSAAKGTAKAKAGKGKR